jgi:A/G-specific adenine glycosylase
MSRTVVMPLSKPSRRRLGREALRAWYAPRRRAYPWRGSHDPYAVWVSEVMLQQTQASRVAPAFRSFLRRFPTVRELAAAARRDVVHEWGGLGYNRRAVRLSEAARAIVRDHGGRMPRDPATLRELPGVGPYTAAAVASLGFGQPVAVVDTNVRRVVARVHLGSEGHEAPAKEVWALANAWLDRDDPGTWNQALMDLGREVCRPNPRCDACPLSRVCRFRLAGSIAARGPVRQGPFEGSGRQVRGAVVRALRSHPSLTRTRLAHETGFPPERIDVAVGALATDGLVEDVAGAVRLAE